MSVSRGRRDRYGSWNWVSEHAFSEHSSTEEQFAPMARNPVRPPEVGSNDVLCREYRSCFYFQLPAFVRLTVQDIHMIDLEHVTAQISAILIISVYYGQLPVELVDQLETSLHLEVSHRFHVCLKERNFDEDLHSSLKTIRNETTKIITFIVRGFVPAVVTSDVFWTPFERLKLNLFAILTCMELQFLGKPVRVNFNIMKRNDDAEEEERAQREQEGWWRKLWHCITPKVLPESSMELINEMFNLQHDYDFAEYAVDQTSRRVSVYDKMPDLSGKLTGLTELFLKICSKKPQPPAVEQPQQESESDESLYRRRKDIAFLLESKDPKVSTRECFFLDSLRQQKIVEPRSWNVISFRLELMSYPLSALTTILMPVLWLSLINLVIYYQQVSLANRISNIALLLLAFVTFLPAVRIRIAQSPKFTILEIMLYLTMVSSFFCLLRSVVSRNSLQPPYSYNMRHDPLSIISLCMLLIILATTVVLYLARVLFYSRTRRSHFKCKSKKADLEDRKKWHNKDCDEYHLKSEHAEKCRPFATEFFQKENIFYRLWLWRYCRSKLPPFRDEEECVIETVKWNDRDSLTYYQHRMLQVVQKYFEHFMRFKLLVNRKLHYEELLEKNMRPGCNLSSIYQFQLRRIQAHLRNSTGIFNDYMTAKHQLVRDVHELEEFVTEDIEIWFRLKPERLGVPSCMTATKLGLMENDTRAAREKLRSNVINLLKPSNISRSLPTGRVAQ